MKEDNRGKISVIIPVYNVSTYVREALDSVVNQTYKNLEIIVVDDGSTDGSGEICDEYASRDPRFTVIHQKNGGLSNARNTGLDHATGDFVSFLDPDDAYHPSFIEELLFAIADADIAVCRYAILKTEGRLIAHGGSERGVQPGAKAGSYGREDSLRMIVNGTINNHVWNKLYRAKMWESNRFPDGHNYEDIDTTYRVIDLSISLTVIDSVLYYYRRHSGSITQTLSWKNINDWKKSMSCLEEFVCSHTPEIFTEKDGLRFRSFWLTDAITRYMMISSDDEWGEAQKEELRKEIIAIGQQIGTEDFPIRRRALFFMVKHYPQLLKIAYPLYSPIRMLLLRIVRK